MFAPSSGEPERILSELSNEMMSPYCPGRTIASCPSDNARKLEDQILAQAQAGKSRDEIEQSLVERFGPQIVGYAPQPTLMWGAAITGLVGLLVVAWMGRRWLRPAGASVAAATTASDVTAAAAGSPTHEAGSKAVSKAERARLDDALDDLDEF